MARTARVVVEGMPHHVIQRGNRRQKVFFNDEDRLNYLKILKEQTELHGLRIWAYCLMDNHVHLITVPEHKESLAKGLGETHKRYTRMINFREKWRGYLWQDRFKSFVLDERHVYAAVRYVERNPVRAKMVMNAEEYAYSSARARVNCFKDDLLSDFYLTEQINDWSKYLMEDDRLEDLKLLRRHGVTGRPLGSSEFLEWLSRRLGVDLRPKKPGPKPKSKKLGLH